MTRRFPDNLLDEIRDKLPVAHVVGRKVKLSRAGKELKGLSPFNKEHTASFFINESKGRWFCFSSGKSGDIFSFLQETEGLSFPEAVERLAQEAGVPLPTRDAPLEARQRSIVDVLDQAQERFVAALTLSKEARDYLKARQIDDDSIRKFGIGYAPHDGAGVSSLPGVDPALLVDSGLVVDTGERRYPRFRDRITFPIRSPRGKIIAFAGRDLTGAAPAKYINSPETPTFSKGGTLFGLDVADRSKPIVVVEGYFDVVQSARSGLNPIAPMGTALTEAHLRQLWQHWDAPIVCFDGDAAGQRAAAKTIRLALPLLTPAKTIRLVFLPNGLDPDELFRKRGPEALRRAVEAHRPLSEAFYRLTTQGRSLSLPEARSAIQAEMVEAYQAVPDRNLRRELIQDVRQRFWVQRSKGPRKLPQSTVRLQHDPGDSGGLSLREAVILARLAKDPDHADPEKIIAANGVSLKVMAVLSEIFCAIGTGDTDVFQRGPIGEVIKEARAICRGAGIGSL